MKKRITGEEIEISYKNTHKFFEKRAEGYNRNYPYTTTMYQDNNPQLTVERDIFEKEQIFPLLKIDHKSKVLDIGCGIGRWAETLLNEDICIYKGIDFSKSLIEIARKNICNNNEKIRFEVLSAQEANSENITDNKFNRFILSGVLLYLNDKDIKNCFKGILSLAEQNSIIYIREPISIKNRLTLNNFHSEELNAKYSAIYRDINQYLKEINQTFIANDFKISYRDFLFPDKLNNRKETEQYFFIIERK